MSIKDKRNKKINTLDLSPNIRNKKIIISQGFAPSLIKDSKLFKKQILNNSIDFYKRTLLIFNYRLISLRMEALIISDILNKNINHSEEFKKDAGEFIRDKENFEKNNKTCFQNIITEKAFIDYYQSFEDFIFKCFCSVYKLFPKFLLDKQNDNLKVNFNNIFENDEVEICREAIIEGRIIDIMHDPIDKIIDKFFLFGLKINLEETINGLRLISLKRNLLEHNNGIINNEFLNKIQKIKVGYNYKKGNRLFISEKELKKEFKLIQESVELIEKGILSSLPTLINKYNSIK